MSLSRSSTARKAAARRSGAIRSRSTGMTSVETSPRKLLRAFGGRFGEERLGRRLEEPVLGEPPAGVRGLIVLGLDDRRVLVGEHRRRLERDEPGEKRQRVGDAAEVALALGALEGASCLLDHGAHGQLGEVDVAAIGFGDELLERSMEPRGVHGDRTGARVLPLHRYMVRTPGVPPSPPSALFEELGCSRERSLGRPARHQARDLANPVATADRVRRRLRSARADHACVMVRCAAARAAISGRCVIAITWRVRPMRASTSPTRAAVSPPMPVSTSSRTSTGASSSVTTALSASASLSELAAGRAFVQRHRYRVAVRREAEVDLVDSGHPAAHRCPVAGVDAIDVEAAGQHDAKARVRQLERAELRGDRSLEALSRLQRAARSAVPPPHRQRRDEHLPRPRGCRRTLLHRRPRPRALAHDRAPRALPRATRDAGSPASACRAVPRSR